MGSKFIGMDSKLQPHNMPWSPSPDRIITHFSIGFSQVCFSSPISWILKCFCLKCDLQNSTCRESRGGEFSCVHRNRSKNLHAKVFVYQIEVKQWIFHHSISNPK